MPLVTKVTAVPILIKVECNRIFSAYLNIISGCILKRNVQEVSSLEKARTKTKDLDSDYTLKLL